MSGSPRVVIVGGGIGGLCLAQGLHKAGIAVEVYERDRARDAYLPAINPAGSRSLRACSPDPLWQASLATAGRGGELEFLTERLASPVVVEESTMYPGCGADPVEGRSQYWPTVVVPAATCWSARTAPPPGYAASTCRTLSRRPSTSSGSDTRFT